MVIIQLSIIFQEKAKRSEKMAKQDRFALT